MINVMVELEHNETSTKDCLNIRDKMGGSGELDQLNASQTVRQRLVFKLRQSISPLSETHDEYLANYDRYSSEEREVFLKDLLES